MSGGRRCRRGAGQGDVGAEPAAAGVRQPELRRHVVDERLQPDQLSEVVAHHLEVELPGLADEVVGAGERDPLRRRRQLDPRELESPLDQVQYRHARGRHGPCGVRRGRRHRAQLERARAHSPAGVVQGELVEEIAVRRRRERRRGKLEVLEHGEESGSVGREGESRQRTGLVEVDLEAAGDRAAGVDAPLELEADRRVSGSAALRLGRRALRAGSRRGRPRARSAGRRTRSPSSRNARRLRTGRDRRSRPRGSPSRRGDAPRSR